MLTKKAPYYEPIGKEIEIFQMAAENSLPLLLKGPTGSGKSRFLEYMAHTLGRRLITILCNDETSSVDLVGRFLVKGADTIWMDGPLTTGVKEGAIVYLDEVAEARPDTLVTIHSLTDHRRTLFLERKNEEIQAHPDFLLVASYNPGYQRGFKELKPSTKQRFLGMDFPYPNASVEEKIIVGETGINDSISKKLVQFAGLVRNKPELGLAETVSTRLLVSCAKLMAKGLPARLAGRTAIILPLSDDLDTVSALQDSFDLIF
ncbi:CbbQ/NirQ/NorQ/GpvN family protein [Leptospira bandrabouensis]|uniref:CbbQ/NirQ/NorQ/GpvN family protein n=1 Tax=Leptospira bandrabouensis TaxID=2484903 RepID=A0A6H3NT09_9LEPT|nr:CbbQ/NirQ/NorQ/GpvN family protein [Leptospira bandrabouensis]MCW7456818.1 CbbQ/NirQ/NorQ/GpvN family protein [Leptospira bandrabouensis]MCW7475764.1 CbbQ/NirQ/NorQ/GpvN family protein [Leptospira bandrabouensis]MCW7483446.1 CbbQ/NirQ/NorQ/GpvN family protein [Leptospira bandrabouensis]TGN05648.1 CbbQ/NirQ/NorQ/GpvN family protein [Leptospira bandrabouensis]TGN15979.1 CbbQ/NirQ/NorQ/GpvN family protein [Leptospira bandrabouensis]